MKCLTEKDLMTNPLFLKMMRYFPDYDIHKVAREAVKAHQDKNTRDLGDLLQITLLKIISKNH